MAKEDSNNYNGLIKYLAGVLKEVGLAGFIVLIVATTFIFWGSAEQKREFIDIYILLKGKSLYPCMIVVMFLLSIIVISGIYSNKMLKLRKNENNRIGKEKSELQECLINKNLHSSE